MYHLKLALSGIKNAGVMAIACIVIMTSSLLILGVFLISTANLREVLRYAHTKVEIVAFVKDDVSLQGIDSMIVEVSRIPYVESVRYVSKETALRRLKDEFGERSRILDAIDINPLPASLEIILKPQYRLHERIAAVAQHISQFPGVEDISYGRGLIEKLEKVIRALAIADICVGLLVAIAVVVTVSYTVRLTIFARAKLIRVFKLVGASDLFVMKPFLIEGLIHGFISTVLSLLVLYLGYRVVNSRISGVVFMPIGFVLFHICFGLAVAVLGSWVSLRAHLKRGGQY
ncbi:MAG: cell division protein FtsX [bacterium]